MNPTQAQERGAPEGDAQDIQDGQWPAAPANEKRSKGPLIGLLAVLALVLFAAAGAAFLLLSDGPEYETLAEDIADAAASGDESNLRGLEVAGVDGEAPRRATREELALDEFGKLEFDAFGADFELESTVIGESSETYEFVNVQDSGVESLTVEIEIPESESDSLNFDISWPTENVGLAGTSALFFVEDGNQTWSVDVIADAIAKGDRERIGELLGAPVDWEIDDALGGFYSSSGPVMRSAEGKFETFAATGSQPDLFVAYVSDLDGNRTYFAGTDDSVWEEWNQNIETEPEIEHGVYSYATEIELLGNLAGFIIVGADDQIDEFVGRPVDWDTEAAVGGNYQLGLYQGNSRVGAEMQSYRSDGGEPDLIIGYVGRDPQDRVWFVGTDPGIQEQWEVAAGVSE